jgi:cobalt-precorrin 5A hydrolase
MNFAIVAITEKGAELARRLAGAFPQATLHLPQTLGVDEGADGFAEPVTKLLPQLFERRQGLVCIMAAGIVVRTLASCLKGKDSDPAVVVMDEAGQFAVSLLSGHLGGANDLARVVARAVGGRAVITTATDVQGLPAWDDIARREGLGVEPEKNIRRLNGLLLRGQEITLVDRQGLVARHFSGIPGVKGVATFAEAIRSHGAGKVFVTNRFFPQLEDREDFLVLRPRNLVVGIGCNRGTPWEEIEEAVTGALQHSFLSLKSVGALATVREMADEKGLSLFAGKYRLPIEYHTAEALNAVLVSTESSAPAQAAAGAKGVCEPAALLSAGRGATLLVKKRILGNMTVAVAERGREA